MDTLQNRSNSKIAIVDYSPAELKKGNKGVWRIEYYCFNPVTKKLKRFQMRVKPMANKTHRERFAKQKVAKLNNLLERGWNPILNKEASQSFAIFQDVILQYERNLDKQLKDGSLRPDSVRSNKSFAKNLKEWAAETYGADAFCLIYDKRFLVDFLDLIYYGRNNSPRTYNNYLSFLNTLSKYLLKRDYIKANPAEAFERKKVGAKKRKIVDANARTEIIEYLKKNNKGYLFVTQLMFYELIRRTEMTKLKVKDFNLKEKYITINASVSKNKKEQHVSILNGFIPYLVDHIKNADNEDFIISENFLPGKTPIAPKKLSDKWSKVRKALSLPEEYQLYSLKDTGISMLLLNGVPPIKVRDHARHSELSMTEKYTQRNNAEDLNKFTKEFDFNN